MKLDSQPTISSLNWIFRLLLTGLLTQMLLSYPLWFRPIGVLAYLPLFSFGAELWQQSSIILFPLFTILLLTGIARGPLRWLTGSMMVVAALLMLGNIHRLQVWFYFYMILISVYLFLYKKDLTTLSWLLRVIFILVYCWSGIHKLNVHFVDDIFPWLMEPVVAGQWISDSGFAMAAGLIELGIGIGLALKFTRKAAVIILVIFHLFILYILGPLGHNWNTVVWPWNVLMPLVAIGLFFSTLPYSTVQQLQFFKKNTTSWAVLLLVGVAPFFNIIKITPEQLSFKMYAGSQPEVVFYFDNEDKPLFNTIKTNYSSLETGTPPIHRFQLDDVAFTEFGTPLFTTENTAMRIGRNLCQRLSHPDLGGIWYLEVDLWDRDGGRFEEISCAELMNR